MAQIIQFHPRAEAPAAPAPIEGEIVPVETVPGTAISADCEPPKRRRKPRAKMRVEQHEVSCTRVPRKQHRDLRDLTGILTLDYRGETPWTATFDPSDEAIPNIVAPIEKLAIGKGTWTITTDEGVWAFAVAEGDED
jgi:hypothetical protein